MAQFFGIRDIAGISYFDLLSTWIVNFVQGGDSWDNIIVGFIYCFICFLHFIPHKVPRFQYSIMSNNWKSFFLHFTQICIWEVEKVDYSFIELVYPQKNRYIGFSKITGYGMMGYPNKKKPVGRFSPKLRKMGYPKKTGI